MSLMVSGRYKVLLFGLFCIIFPIVYQYLTDLKTIMSIPTKPKVLVIGNTNLLAENKKFNEFSKLFELVQLDFETAEDLESHFKDKYNDISAIFNVHDGIWKVGGPNKFIESFPSSLKVLTYPWVGHDKLHTLELKAKGVTVCNVGSVSAPHVADGALQLVLSAYRLSPFIETEFRKTGDIHLVTRFVGGSEFGPDGTPSLPEKNKIINKYTIGGKLISSPQGHTVGIVGLGAIGKEIAKRLWAIGMKIHYTKRTPLSKEEEAKLPYDLKFYPSFAELAPECDLIVFAVPHSPSTTHFINLDTIKLVKPGVRIVNIGRGSAIDEDVLLKLLDDGTVNSVGLDVFAEEPVINPKFLSRWDVVLTPHTGSMTTDNLILAHELNMKSIEDILIHGGDGITPIN